MEKETRGAVFDLDGTLLDTLPDLARSVNETLVHLGLPERSPSQVQAALGNGSARLLAESMPGAEDRLAEALAYYHTVYPPKEGALTAPFPGIPALLSRLKEEGWRVAILSNKPHGAVLSLRDEFFPGIAAAGDRDGCPRKPDPTALFALMKEEGFDPGRTIYVGDSEVDVALAKNASLPCAAVAWGYRSEAQLKEAGATAIARDTDELYEILTAGGRDPSLRSG